MLADLVDLDSLSIIAIINDEIDLISPSRHPDVDHRGSFAGVPLKSHLGQDWTDAHGGANVELRMDSICCGAHGLSLLVVSHLYLPCTCCRRFSRPLC
jgi:7,8-dihydropterin-6-yl-methyl-4-(beta-D-ribofuranosyl)aminobenzene 5'-phosphate synthase